MFILVIRHLGGLTSDTVQCIAVSNAVYELFCI